MFAEASKEPEKNLLNLDAPEAKHVSGLETEEKKRINQLLYEQQRSQHNHLLSIYCLLVESTADSKERIIAFANFT